MKRSDQGIKMILLQLTKYKTNGAERYQFIITEAKNENMIVTAFSDIYKIITRV